MTFSRLPLARGGVFGAVVYAITYAGVYLTYAGTIRRALGRTTVVTINGPTTATELLAGAMPPTWKGVGWFFYGANGVPIQLPGVTQYLSANVLYNAGPVSYALTGIPIALFIAGGYWTHKTTDSRVGTRAGQWKYAGVGMALGYVTLMVVGALVFGVRVRGRAAGPNLLYSIFAGLSIPVLSGALGARLQARLTE